MTVSADREPLDDAPCMANVYSAICPSRTVLNLVAGRWSPLIIGALADGPQRFGELRRRLDGISQKVLTDKLRGLERDGVIARHVVDRPLEVHYQLTDLGTTLIVPLAALRGWAEDNLPAVRASRQRFDQLGASA